MNEKNASRAKRREHYRAIAEASSIAWMFPIAIALGFGWGWWMDKIFGTWPWLSAIFSAFGVVAGFLNLFRIALKDVRPINKRNHSGS